MATITTGAPPAASAPAANPGIASRTTHQALRNAELANRASVTRAMLASRHASDDEILGLDHAAAAASADQPAEANDPAAEADPDPENLRAAFDEHPELRTAWQDAHAYRETFATPEEAREASTLLADLDRMDALFFSHRPEDHAELARSVATLDPAAFASLAQAMSNHATLLTASNRGGQPGASVAADSSAVGAGFKPAPTTSPTGNPPAPNLTDAYKNPTSNRTGPTQQQAEFFHAANAAAVQGVLDAIETQVARLLPESVSKGARNRVVGEIYRELDLSLRSNRQLAQQMREAYRSGSLDAEHQRALVSLVTGRAKQALPGVAKRVLGEWTSTLVSANQDRLARQRAAEGRIDIAGSGGSTGGARQSRGPRDIDYARMSDSDILNL